MASEALLGFDDFFMYGLSVSINLHSIDNVGHGIDKFRLVVKFFDHGIRACQHGWHMKCFWFF